MSWEWVAGGSTVLLAIIGIIVGISKRWGSDNVVAKLRKKEVEDAIRRLDHVMLSPIPDSRARARAARRKLRELKDRF